MTMEGVTNKYGKDLLEDFFEQEVENIKWVGYYDKVYSYRFSYLATILIFTVLYSMTAKPY
jgi:hypothetical protein